MERYDIFRTYFTACKRICDASEEMYEDLFEDDGTPKHDKYLVEAVIKDFQKVYRIEIDLIRQTALEYSNE